MIEEVAEKLIAAIATLEGATDHGADFCLLADAVAAYRRTKEYRSLMNGGCSQFATLFSAIEAAVAIER